MSACVGPDLEPPGGGRASNAPAASPGRPAQDGAAAGTHSTETSAAAGSGASKSGDNPNGATLTPPKMAAAGAGGSSSSTGGQPGAGEDAGVEDASVDASSSP